MVRKLIFLATLLLAAGMGLGQTYVGTFNIDDAASTNYGLLRVTTLTGERTYTYPNKSGTVAMTSDIASGAADFVLGSSGTAGSLIIYPATAANGYTLFTATNNGAARNLTVTNVAQSSTSGTVKFPDMAGGTGQLVATDTDYKLTLTMNASARTLNLGGNITTTGAVSTGAVTLGGALTTAAAVTFSGANAATFTIPAGGSTVTFPTSGTLLTDTGDLTGTNQATFTLDADGTYSKLVLSASTATASAFNLILKTATIATATRTLTLPDPGGADSVVYLALAQTLTTKTLTAPVVNGLTAASGDFDFSGSAAGTFTTCAGENLLKGNVTIDAAKTFATGTGTVTLNGNTTISSSKTFTTGTGAVTIGGNTASTGNITFDFSGSNTTFKTSTGTNTFGGNTVVAAGKTLAVGTTSGGVANAFLVYSPTAANGAIIINPPDNGGARNLTITNEALTQSSIVKFPDLNAATIQPVCTTTDYTVSVNANGADRAISLAGGVTTAAAFTTTGAFAMTLTATEATTATLPGGTVTLSGLSTAETFSGLKTFTAAPLVLLNNTTAGVSTAGTFIHSTSDEPAAGDGVRLSLQLENAEGTNLVEEWASIDAVSTAITNGTEYGDIVLRTMVNGTVVEAIRIDADGGLKIGKALGSTLTPAIVLYSPTTGNGSLRILSANNTGDTQCTITNAAQGGAYTYTFGDAGASKYVAYTAQAAGTIARSDLTEESLMKYPIALQECRNLNGTAMDATGAATAFKINNGGIAAGTLTLTGVLADGATVTSTLCKEFSLPPDYLADQDVKVVVTAKYLSGNTPDHTTHTVDVVVFEIADNGTAAAVLASSAQAITDTAADYTFVVPDAGLVVGDRLMIYVQTVMTEGGGSVGQMTATISNIEVLMDIKP